MKKPAGLLLTLGMMLVASGASADPWKDESGHGRYKERREYKQEYWDGNCKVERKYERNGEYKEERKCKPARRAQSEYRYRPVVEERRYYETVEVPVRRRDAPEVHIDVHVGR